MCLFYMQRPGESLFVLTFDTLYLLYAICIIWEKQGLTFGSKKGAAELYSQYYVHYCIHEALNNVAKM